MIQLRSKLKVADNSGAKIIRCLKILGGSGHRYAQIGDIIVASVREVEPRKLIKKGELVKALVIRQKKAYRRLDGSYIRFDDNAAVILDGIEPKGSRILGPVPKEIKEKGFKTIASMAGELV